MLYPVAQKLPPGAKARRHFLFWGGFTGLRAQKRTRPVGGGSSSRANGAAPSLVWPRWWHQGQGPDTDEWCVFKPR
ncbi:hypothetical protein TMES_01815 [Thalassospira mesophila]|uniref:Uncharacterized protein n=1 Tax=Thalassospira mesophila TaxID=1293891 RepID=A0A1Y2L6R1_9PROT|nr:hypothetical protein TMES_01815 [Thalassospira mesophila]